MLLEGVDELDLAHQHRRQPDRCVEVEGAGDLGAPQVGVDQRHPLPGLRQGERQVDRRGRLALLRHRAGHDVDAAAAGGVDVDELHVGAQHAERLGPRRVAVQRRDQRLLGRGRLERDRPEEGRLGDGDRLLGRLDRGVEQLPHHGEAEPEQQSQDRRQAVVAQRLRDSPGVAVEGRRVDDGGLDGRGPGPRRRLQVADQHLQLLRVASGPPSGPLGGGVGDGDREDARSRGRPRPAPARGAPLSRRRTGRARRPPRRRAHGCRPGRRTTPRAGWRRGRPGRRSRRPARWWRRTAGRSRRTAASPAS